MTSLKFVLPKTLYDKLTAVDQTAAVIDTMPGSITEGHMLDASSKQVEHAAHQPQLHAQPE